MTLNRPNGPLLYLASDRPLSDDMSIDCFRAIVERYHPAAFRLPEGDERATEQQVERIRDICISGNVAMILTDNPEKVGAWACDGVHMTDASRDVAATRRVLPPLAQLGVHCGSSRDAAMQAGESGADYISIDAEADDLAQWWLEMAELPLVVEQVNTQERARSLSALGVDFLHVVVDFTKSVEHVDATLAALGFSASQDFG